MKKTISLLLSLLLVLGVFGAAFSAAAEEKTELRTASPVIYIGGNGEDIVDRNNNEEVLYDFTLSKDQVAVIAKRVVPLLIAGWATQDFDAYYKAFGEEVTKLYEKLYLDEDGNPRDGVSIPLSDERETLWNRTVNRISGGTYGVHDYHFWYDWRLSPLVNAEKLAEHIRAVYRVTGRKVSIYSRCIGGCVAEAYLTLYPEEARQYVANVAFDANTGNGCEMLDDVYTGNIKIDGEAAARTLDHLETKEMFSSESYYIYEFLCETLDFANEFYLADLIEKFTMEQLYATLGEGLLKTLLVASYGTWLGYWPMIPPAHLETALNNVFGEEGSEGRAAHAGLIRQIRAYNDQVALKQADAMRTLKDGGMNFAVVSKYGWPMNFYCGDSEKLGDMWVSVNYASFGATTGDIYHDLPDDYLARAAANDTDKYISPDKKVDASTCLFPDTTWFIKGCSHENYPVDAMNILLRFFDSNGTMTVFTDPASPQYLVALTDTFQDGDCDVVPMTEENMNADRFDLQERPPEDESKLHMVFRRLSKLLRFLGAIVAFLNKQFGWHLGE